MTVPVEGQKTGNRAKTAASGEGQKTGNRIKTAASGEGSEDREQGKIDWERVGYGMENKNETEKKRTEKHTVKHKVKHIVKHAVKHAVKSLPAEILRFSGSILLDLLYPRRCPLCERIVTRREGNICGACKRKLPYIREPLCKKCGKPLEEEEREYCRDCECGKHRFVCGRSVFLYEKEFRRSVHRMKFENRREYLDFYAQEMAAAGAKLAKSCGIRVLIPVPMNRKKRRERGFDQSRILAEKIGAILGIPVDAESLVRNRYTRPQKELDAVGRKNNLRGAFTLREGARIPEPVLIIDDIYTTGATVDEICRTLQTAGVSRIYFLALCTGKGK